ncbi:isopentenyl-diphosphate Delta-isomerase [Micromonospora sp. NBC_01813]|uniref:isopentenyl-diphosphate Delta-isomerase n=1 Tax=Micromonospora sp. NBC_01813 TaxID=2975988 RepID=UPI002DDB6BBC|nr:isopentenyl-diphosphate Delta-isomerase [Micromonospora sp. NBC_01813]WSA07656.1 isopentenyl-diphosphate Delta-isomerase [Micromonospora sp. NBC_01813]
MTVHARESHLVELVDPTGRPVGSATVADAHHPPGQLHRAFSVLLVDDSGRLLLQQRAAVKTRFPLRWANTCCGHPLPGEDLSVAANRRLGEEIGVEPVTLTEIGVHTYQATDPVTGRTEYEYDHVLLGSLDPQATLRPDPQEVAQLRWVGAQELRAGLADEPDSYAPWLTGVADHLFAQGNLFADGGGSTQGRQEPGTVTERSGGR